jgi:two-component system, OmpR family, sensor kinase
VKARPGSVHRDPARDGDVDLVRAAARRLGLQAAVLVALTVLLMAAFGAGLVVAAQNSAAEDLVRQAAVSADDAGDPPAATWLALRDEGGLRVTPRTPHGLPDTRAMDTVARTGRTQVQVVDIGPRDYLVRTIRRGGTTVQALLDLTAQHRQRAALARVLAEVGVVGLALSAVAGTLLARRAVRPLSDALALQRAFIADASHELRTPLTLLATRAQMLRRSLVRRRADPAVLGDADGVVSDVARMTDLVEELLVAADPGQDWQRRSVDLVALTTDLLSSAEDHARSRRVAIELVRRGTPEVRTHGNDVALRRAVLALVDNAIEHTSPGGHVRLILEAQSGLATIEVCDTGTGIPPGEAHRVFDRFRSASQKANRRSYGLGLALARDVISRHGGRLVLTRTSSRGTSFRVQLPGD